jgi:Pregnancy-associated plasma protein-A/Secretion system C-terminal sorting domain
MAAMWYVTALYEPLLPRMKKQGNSLVASGKWQVAGGRHWSMVIGQWPLVIRHCSLSFVLCSLICSVGLAQTTDTDNGPWIRCATAEVEAARQAKNPARKRQVENFNQRVADYLLQEQANGRASADNTIYRIPVVVHVVHNNSSNFIGGDNNPNISDAQIASQIEVLNNDYRRKTGTAGFNTSAVGADVGIEFYLAKKDPNGQPSTGITRHYYAQQNNFNVNSNADALTLSTIADWPADCYLNIWVTTLTQSYLGYTQFPVSIVPDTLQGLVSEADVRTDGTVIDYRNFGVITTGTRARYYGGGRTVTHEIGHWLGLLHTWGDIFCGTDYVADTPEIESANQTTSCADRFSSCGNGRVRNQIENYMDYSPDGCMNIFTLGQRARMRAVLQLSPLRARLLKCATALPEAETLTLNLYPNPATTGTLNADVLLKGFQTFTVGLYNLNGQLLQSRNYTDSPSTSTSLTTFGLPGGVYVVRVQSGSETVSKRLLVQ